MSNKVNDFRIYLQTYASLDDSEPVDFAIIADHLQAWLYKNDLEITLKPKTNATELHQRTLTPTFKSL